MKPFVDTCIRFFKKETVLCIAGFLAFISAFFVHPSAAYMRYIDFRVLSLLFSLMLVVAGFQSIGLFHCLGSALLTKVHTTRQLILVLSLLCFFSSMFITNDVALIAFLPFTLGGGFCMGCRRFVPVRRLQGIRFCGQSRQVS